MTLAVDWEIPQTKHTKIKMELSLMTIIHVLCLKYQD